MEPNRYNSNMGFMEWLALMLIGLKASGKTKLPWWIVLAPIWFPVATVAALIAFVTIYNMTH